MPKDEDVKAAMHHSEAEHNIKLPKKDKSKKVWIIISIILALALVGAGVYGYLKMRDYNKKNYSPDKGVSPLFVIIARLLALFVVEMSWSQVYDYFGFNQEKDK